MSCDWCCERDVLLLPLYMYTHSVHTCIHTHTSTTVAPNPLTVQPCRPFFPRHPHTHTQLHTLYIQSPSIPSPPITPIKRPPSPFRAPVTVPWRLYPSLSRCPPRPFGPAIGFPNTLTLLHIRQPDRAMYVCMDGWMLRPQLHAACMWATYAICQSTYIHT